MNVGLFFVYVVAVLSVIGIVWHVVAESQSYNHRGRRNGQVWMWRARWVWSETPERVGAAVLLMLFVVGAGVSAAGIV